MKTGGALKTLQPALKKDVTEKIKRNFEQKPGNSKEGANEKNPVLRRFKYMGMGPPKKGTIPGQYPVDRSAGF
jgi:hypothetical protein